MPKKVVEVEFRGTDRGVIATMKSQGASADQLKKKYAELEKAAESAGKKAASGGSRAGNSSSSGQASVIKSLREGLGRRSSIGQIGQILAGGGAIGGLSYLAKDLGEAAEKAHALDVQFHAGKISAGEMVSELAKGLPVIGSFITAGQQIRSFLADGSGGKLFGDQHRRQVKERAQDARGAANDFAESLEADNGGIEDRERELRWQTRQAAARDRLRISTLGLKGSSADVGRAREQQYEGSADIESRRQQELEKNRQNERAAASRHGKDLSTAVEKIENSGASQDDQTVQIKRVMSAQKAELAKFLEERNQINQQYDEQLRNQNYAANEAVLQADREARKAALDTLRGYHREAAALSEKGQELQLRTEGRGFEAEIAAIRSQTTARLEEMKIRQQKELDEIHPDARPALEELQKQQLAGEEAFGRQQEHDAATKAELESQRKALAALAATDDARAKYQLEQLDTVKSFNSEVAAQKAILGDANQTDLHAQAAKTLELLTQGRSQAEQYMLRQSELEILRLQAAAGDDLAAAELKRLETAKQNLSVQQRLKAVLDNPDASSSSKDEARRQLGQLDQSGRQAIDKQLKDQGEADLQRESENGPTPQSRRAAKLALAAAKTADEYRKRQAEAQSILTNPSATADQKAAALQSLKGFAATAGQDVDAAGGKVPIAKKTFDLQERGLLLSGVSAGAAAHDPQQETARRTAEGAKATSDLLKAFQDFANKFGPGTPAPPPPSPVFNGQ